MDDSDKRRDDEQDETPEWNTPAAADDEAGELSVAVRRVLASDQHLSERRVFYGRAGADEEEPDANAEKTDAEDASLL